MSKKNISVGQDGIVIPPTKEDENYNAIELLFEINSAFDHLKRIHVEKSPEEKESEKAYSHLKRGCLDAYKLKLKYFNVNVSFK